MFGKLFGHRKKPEHQVPLAVPAEETPQYLEFIRDCLENAEKIGRDYMAKLDYTAASIPAVSGILDGYHRRYLHPEEDDSIIRDNAEDFAEIFGVYIGETLLRCHPDSGYGWEEKPGFGLVVAKGEGYHIDAIAKAAKQIVNGRENGDEIGSFFDVAELLMEGKFPAQ